MRLYLLLLAGLCGIASATESYIINGNNVTVPGKWPWQGSLRKILINYSHSCGISLISPKWGVTAAHCVQQNAAPSRLQFMFGSNERESNQVLVGATRVIKHEKYMTGPGMFPNDIAVIEFDQEVVGENITPVPLAPNESEHANNPDCWITGWGHTEYGGEQLPKILQEGHVNVYTHADCVDIWGSFINTGHVCMGNVDKGISSCQGDSGGPLVCKVGDRYELVGVTSFGQSGCGASMPSIYSKVAYFRDWIREKTGI